jgi:hypothetical protein
MLNLSPTKLKAIAKKHGVSAAIGLAGFVVAILFGLSYRVAFVVSAAIWLLYYMRIWLVATN